MKSRIWIVLALAVGLMAGNVVNATPAMADDDCMEWTLLSKDGQVPPGGDDGGSDVEGDPENWLGGQNRPASDKTDDGGWNVVEWFEGLVRWMTSLWW